MTPRGAGLENSAEKTGPSGRSSEVHLLPTLRAGTSGPRGEVHILAGPGTSLRGQSGVWEGKDSKAGGKGMVLSYICESVSSLDGIKGR